MKQRKEAERKGYIKPMIFPHLRITFPKPTSILTPDIQEDDVVQGMADLFVGVIITEESEAESEFSLVDADQMTNWTAHDLPTHREFR